MTTFYWDLIMFIVFLIMPWPEFVINKVVINKYLPQQVASRKHDPGLQERFCHGTDCSQGPDPAAGGTGYRCRRPRASYTSMGGGGAARGAWVMAMAFRVLCRSMPRRHGGLVPALSAQFCIQGRQLGYLSAQNPSECGL